MSDHQICASQEVVWCIGEVLEPRAQSNTLEWASAAKGGKIN